MPAAPSKPFLPALLENLTDPEEAAAYIVAARAHSMEMFLTAIRDVAQAHQMASVAKLSGVTRENLYRAFSAEGNPTTYTLNSVLSAVGLELLVAPKGTAIAMASSSASFIQAIRRNPRQVAKRSIMQSVHAGQQLFLPLKAEPAKAAEVTVVSESIQLAPGYDVSSTLASLTLLVPRGGSLIQQQQRLHPPIEETGEAVVETVNPLTAMAAATINVGSYASL